MAGSSPEDKWEQREQRLLTPEKMTPLSDLSLGKGVGRGGPSEITCFTSLGIPIQFAAVALKTYQLAREKGLGRELPLGWFLQDIHN